MLDLLPFERAERMLDALAVDVVTAPGASDRLHHLVTHGPTDPEAVRVFACVLYLGREDEGATWWWQLAAGADDNESAYCLRLDHMRRGEFNDAALWEEWLCDHFVPRSVAAPSVERAYMTRKGLRFAVMLLPRVNGDPEFGRLPCPTPRLADIVASLRQL
ncbi:hypothetical protein [Streptomyces sp. NPDC048603]|uniref:hypothetical protein n=1 Tax=Streptomyces sp. NPDC048603 TaxID=3365577 RepID=UPI00371136E1